MTVTEYGRLGTRNGLRCPLCQYSLHVHFRLGLCLIYETPKKEQQCQVHPHTPYCIQQNFVIMRIATARVDVRCFDDSYVTFLGKTFQSEGLNHHPYIKYYFITTEVDCWHISHFLHHQKQKLVYLKPTLTMSPTWSQILCRGVSDSCFTQRLTLTNNIYDCDAVIRSNGHNKYWHWEQTIMSAIQSPISSKWRTRENPG